MRGRSRICPKQELASREYSEIKKRKRLLPGSEPLGFHIPREPGQEPTRAGRLLQSKVPSGQLPADKFLARAGRESCGLEFRRLGELGRGEWLPRSQATRRRARNHPPFSLRSWQEWSRE